jgi:hypothetical protein
LTPFLASGTPRRTKQHGKILSKHERKARRNRENRGGGGVSGGSGGGVSGGSGGSGGGVSGGSGGGEKGKSEVKEKDSENRNGNGKEKEKAIEKGKEGGEANNDVSVHHIPVHHKHPHARTHTNNTHTHTRIHTNNTHTNHTHINMRKIQSTKTHTDTSHLRSLFYHYNKTRHEKKHEYKHENKHENKIGNKNEPEYVEYVDSSMYSNGTYGNITVNGTWELCPNVSTNNTLDSMIQNGLKYLDIKELHENRVFMWHKNTEMTPFDKRIQSAAQLNHIKVITEENEGTV